MESIIICNRINNNTGLKQTHATGYFSDLFRETTEFNGGFYLSVSKQDSISHHVTAGSLLSMTGYVKFRGSTRNETKKWSLEKVQSNVTILTGRGRPKI